MEQIGIYFKRFENIGRSEREIKFALQEAILSVLGDDVSDILTLDKIEIQKDKIRVKISGPLKNELVLNKNKLELMFKEKLSEKGSKKDLKIV